MNENCNDSLIGLIKCNGMLIKLIPSQSKN